MLNFTPDGDRGRGIVAAEGTDPHGVGAQHDLVVVANRLPVVAKEMPDGSPDWQRSPGGLVSALEPVMQRTDGVWVGWSGTAGTAPDPWDSAGMHLVGVSLSADEVEGSMRGSVMPRCGRSITT